MRSDRQEARLAEQDDMTLPAVSAAVLVGGRSRRMGEPKALLRIEPDCPTFLERVVESLQPVAPDVFLVGCAEWEVPGSLAAIRRVRDGGRGAADGVVCALKASRFDTCLIVGCDMPFLDVPLLREMTLRTQQSGVGVIACNARGPHPLHAMYKRIDLERIRTFIASGQRSLTSIADLLGMEKIDVDAPERGSAHSWSVFNVNTPEDLKLARNRAFSVRHSDAEDFIHADNPA